MTTLTQRAHEDAIIAQARQIIRRRLKPGQAFTEPADFKAYMVVELAEREHECFGIVYLTNQHHLIAFEELFRGTIDGASVYPREVIKRALYHNAAAVALYHNHPSGIAEPSQADKSLTAKLRIALTTVDIRILDHFIVGGDTVLSFAEKGLL